MRVRGDILKNREQITVQVVEGEKKGKRFKQSRDAVFFKLLIFAIDWYIALDNSVVISGFCCLVLIWRSSYVC